MRSNILNAYRRLLIVARGLPQADRVEAVNKIKKEFRAPVSNDIDIQDLLQRAISSLGYLKMITPKTNRDKQAEHVKIVFGQNESGSTRKAVTNWHGGNMDPDSMKRHYQGLKRAGFRDNSHAKGVF